MDRIIRRNIPFTLSADALMADLGLGEDFADEFQEIYGECLRAANPKYMIAACPVRREGEATYIGGEAFQSRVMAVNLEDVATVYAYAVTCGRELYELALQKDDPLERYWVDAFSERALYQAGNRALEEVRRLAGSEGVNNMNPGSLSDFPLTNQKQLFRLLGNAREEIGIELTDSCLMLPYKSLSGFYYVSEEHFVNCALCQRVNCPNRRAEFDEMMYSTRYALG